MKEYLELRFPLGSDMMTTVRLATGGVCSRAGLDLDASEDCKVCVTESLLLLGHSGYRGARMRFSDDGGLRVEILGESRGSAAPSSEDEISYALLSALADVEFERADGALSSVKFTFGKK